MPTRKCSPNFIAYNLLKLNLKKFVLVLFISTALFGCGDISALKDFSRAEDFFGEGSFGSALALYGAVVAKYPESEYAAKSQYKIAYIYKNFLNDDTRAIREYVMYLSLYPEGEDVIDARGEIAELYSKVGEYWRAIKEYQNLSNIDSDNLEARYHYVFKIAMEYLKINELRQARIEFREITEKSANQELVEKSFYQVANTYYLEGSNEKAIKAFEEFLKSYPESSLYLDAALGKASILSEQAKLEEAVKWLKDLQLDYPNEESIRIRLTSVYDRIESGPKLKKKRRKK